MSGARSSRRVPAWTVAVSEHSVDDYVYVLDLGQPDPLTPGGLKTKLLHRLTPVTVAGADDFGHPAVACTGLTTSTRRERRGIATSSAPSGEAGTGG